MNTGALISPIRDARVACPSEAWLKQFYSDVLKPCTHTWTTEKFDCDDFSIRAVDRATECLVQTADLSECGHGICISYIHVRGNLANVTDTNHACNIIRLDDRWVFFEPQNGIITDAEEAIADGRANPYFFLL